jgi:ADP-ribose pyrophosphatase
MSSPVPGEEDDYHDDAILRRFEGVWADPPHVARAEVETRLTWVDGILRTLAEAGVQFDRCDKPINPYAPLHSRRGRHTLGRWGPNHAADPILTRDGPTDEAPKELLTVQRCPDPSLPYGNLLALPGGFVDPGESFATAAVREAFEEALDHDAELERTFATQATPVYKGYADDPRVTRNAWIETCTFHVHLTWEASLRLTVKSDGDGHKETAAAFWSPLTRETLLQMYSHHPRRVEEACAIRGWAIHSCTPALPPCTPAAKGDEVPSPFALPPAILRV